MSTRFLFLSAAFSALAFCAIAISGCSSNVAAPLSVTPTVEPTTVETAPMKNAPVVKTQETVKAPAVKTIVWRTNYEAALKEAAKTRKPLMVDFYTDWCGACKMMDAEAYPEAQVIEMSRSFVMVKVDGDKRPDLVQKFQVTGYPSVFWLDGDGKVLNTMPGYGGVEMMKSEMKTALSNFEPTV